MIDNYSLDHRRMLWKGRVAISDQLVECHSGLDTILVMQVVMVLGAARQEGRIVMLHCIFLRIFDQGNLRLGASIKPDIKNRL